MAKPVIVASSKEFNERRIQIPDWNHPWRQMGRSKLEFLNRRGKVVTVLTGDGSNAGKTIIASA